MSVSLLNTKLFVPQPRKKVVSRERLLRVMDRAVEGKLTLVSAPPGFGKTTLLSGWVASRAGVPSIAWLSLDEGDNEPVVFWSYVVAAIQSAMPGACASAGALLESAQPVMVDDVLAAVINDLSTNAKDLVLVLDDYHVISHRLIHQQIGFLLEHMPADLHLVIASRVDPSLELARLRVRGELVEVRADDLRFLPEEAEAFMHEVMELEMSAAELDVLEARTEGWIAALQLAGLSIRGRSDVSKFVEAFAGNNRYIVDYLVQEVLQGQEKSVREFLLETSILDRLNGSLCDAVTGRHDGAETLRSLEQANIFVVPMDDHRMWYRYHRLFADVLRVHLSGEGAERVKDLHQRASAWHEQHQELSEAIRHALAGADYVRAAGLIEDAFEEKLKSRQDATVRRWFESLPSGVLRLRPVLAAAYAGVLLQGGEPERVEELLDGAEVVLRDASPVGKRGTGVATAPAYVNERQFRELPGMIALYRAGCAQVRGSLADTEKYARRALELMSADAPLRGGALALLGLALWSRGDLAAAQRTYREGIAIVHRDGWVNDSSAIMLGDMLVAQGKLRDARDMYERALQDATEQGSTAPRGSADLHVGISEICREQGDVEAALEHLSSSRTLGESAGLPENRYRWYTAMAEIKAAGGDPVGALELLDEAERLYTPGFAPEVRPTAALRARVLIRQGKLDLASELVDVTADDELNYLREFEHVTLARLLMAKSGDDPTGQTIEEAIDFLIRLSDAAEADGRTGTLIEVLVLLAIAEQSRGDDAAALTSIERALALAEPQGFARVFLDEGPPMDALLALAAKGGRGDYARWLLGLSRRRDHGRAQAPSSQERLSERELEVVRLLATELSGPDIANELVISLNTMRTHTKSIYNKLGVSSRGAAVRRAHELRLL